MWSMVTVFPSLFPFSFFRPPLKNQAEILFHYASKFSYKQTCSKYKVNNIALVSIDQISDVLQTSYFNYSIKLKKS